jgi:hypothetical protein
MKVDKLNVWDDARVQKRAAHLNGRTYGRVVNNQALPFYTPFIPVAYSPFQGYLYGEPKGGFRETIFLVRSRPPTHLLIHSHAQATYFTRFA